MNTRIVLLSVIGFLSFTCLEVPSATAEVILLNDLRKTTVNTKAGYMDYFEERYIEDKDSVSDSPATPFGAFNSSISASSILSFVQANGSAKQISSITPAHMQVSGEMTADGVAELEGQGSGSAGASAEAASRFETEFELSSSYAFDLFGDVSTIPHIGLVFANFWVHLESSDGTTIYDYNFKNAESFAKSGVLSAGNYKLVMEAVCSGAILNHELFGGSFNFNASFNLSSVVTYRYAGYPFNVQARNECLSCYSPINADRITGTFVLPEMPSNSLQFVRITPVSYDFYDGLRHYTNADACPHPNPTECAEHHGAWFNIATHNGRITRWNIVIMRTRPTATSSDTYPTWYYMQTFFDLPNIGYDYSIIDIDVGSPYWTGYYSKRECVDSNHCVPGEWTYDNMFIPGNHATGPKPHHTASQGGGNHE